MTTKAVILGQKSGDTTDMVLPHTSADLVGYSNPASEATNTQEALDELMEKSPGNITAVADRVTAVEGEVQTLQTGQTGTEDRLDALETSVADKAASGHKHAAGDITSGTLAAARGGTGRTDGKVAALATARTLDGVQFTGAANVTHYATCSTAAATVEKAVALAGFVLGTGARVMVRFTVTNTAANPTLNVNNTGAKPIHYRNAALAAGYLAANRTYEFVYDGSSYEVVGDINTDANTKYAAGAGLTLSGTTFAVKYGATAGTAAQGNDARLAGGADWTANKPGIVQRVETLETAPPKAHKASHKRGGADALTPADIGALAADGKAVSAGTADSAATATNATNAINATYANLAATLRQNGNGGPMTFLWVGQPGQPTWLWGSMNGSEIRVWNPANFRVAFASQATHAANADNVANCNCACQCDGGY